MAKQRPKLTEHHAAKSPACVIEYHYFTVDNWEGVTNGRSTQEGGMGGAPPDGAKGEERLGRNRVVDRRAVSHRIGRRCGQRPGR